jgi:hypothetical protein
MSGDGCVGCSWATSEFDNDGLSCRLPTVEKFQKSHPALPHWHVCDLATTYLTCCACINDDSRILALLTDYQSIFKSSSYHWFRLFFQKCFAFFRWFSFSTKLRDWLLANDIDCEFIWEKDKCFAIRPCVYALSQHMLYTFAAISMLFRGNLAEMPFATVRRGVLLQLRSVFQFDDNELLRTCMSHSFYHKSPYFLLFSTHQSAGQLVSLFNSLLTIRTTDDALADLRWGIQERLRYSVKVNTPFANNFCRLLDTRLVNEFSFFTRAVWFQHLQTVVEIVFYRDVAGIIVEYLKST